MAPPLLLLLWGIAISTLLPYASSQQAACDIDPSTGIKITGQVLKDWRAVANAGVLGATSFSNKDIPDTAQNQTAASVTACNCICNSTIQCVGYTWLGASSQQCWLHSYIDWSVGFAPSYVDWNSTQLINASSDAVVARVVRDTPWPMCTQLVKTASATFKSTSSDAIQTPISNPANISACNQICGSTPRCVAFQYTTNQSAPPECLLYSAVQGPMTNSANTTVTGVLNNCAELLPDTVASALPQSTGTLPPAGTTIPPGPVLRANSSSTGTCGIDARPGVRYQGKVWKGFTAQPDVGGASIFPLTVTATLSADQVIKDSDGVSTRFIKPADQNQITTDPQDCNCRCSKISNCVGYTWLGDTQRCWLHSWIYFWDDPVDTFTEVSSSGIPTQKQVDPRTVIGRVVLKNDPLPDFYTLMSAAGTAKASALTCENILTDWQMAPANSSSDKITLQPTKPVLVEACNAACKLDPYCVGYTWQGVNYYEEAVCTLLSNMTGGLVAVPPGNGTQQFSAVWQTCPEDKYQPASSPTTVNGSSPAAAGSAQSSGGSNNNTAIAVGVAVPIGVLMIGAIAMFLWWRRRRQQAASDPWGLYKGSKNMHGDLESPMSRQVVVTTEGTDMTGLKMAPPTGLLPGDPFLPAASQFGWVDYKANEHTTWVESGINDTQFDKLSQDGTCPAVELKAADMGQIELLKDGLIGKGGAALVFACRWPSRFGPDALLAIKVLRNAYDASPVILQSFSYEANLLAALKSPHVVKLYGYCLELPVVALIMELLPTSLESLLHPTPQQAPFYTTFTNTAVTDGQNNTASGQAAVLAVTRMGLTWGNTTHSSNKDSTNMSGPGSTALQAAPNAGTASNTDMSADVATGEGAATDTTANMNIRRRNTLSMLSILQIAADVSAGLAYLHNRTLDSMPTVAAAATAMPEGNAIIKAPGEDAVGDMPRASKIVHRDLKPANLLINSRGQAKIVDFGLAREFATTTMHTMHVGAGTLLYMAPELLASRMYTGALPFKPTYLVDIYSLGILMWEMLSQQKPWQDMNMAQLVAAVCGSQRPPMPCPDQFTIPPGGQDLASTPAGFGIVPEFDNLIKQCWQHRDHKRPQAADVHKTLQQLLDKAQQLPIQDRE